MYFSATKLKNLGSLPKSVPEAGLRLYKLMSLFF